MTLYLIYLARWKSLIDVSFDSIVQTFVDSGKIPNPPISPKQKIEFVKTYFKKYKAVQEIVPIYVFFKRVPDLQKSREGEFRKNVNLKVKMPNGDVVNINLLKLDEYSQKMDEFIKEIKEILN